MDGVDNHKACGAGGSLKGTSPFWDFLLWMFLQRVNLWTEGRCCYSSKSAVVGILPEAGGFGG